MKRTLTLLLTFSTFVSAAYAHNGMQHVMGTVTAITATSIPVKGTNGTSQTVAITTGTNYLKGTAAISLKDIKPGDHVVIHATKTGDQLTAAEVKVGTMTGMTGVMSGMKMGGDSKSAPH